MFVTHGLQVRIVDIVTKGATLLDNNCGREKKSGSGYLILKGRCILLVVFR